jgi:hypothetical protein
MKFRSRIAATDAASLSTALLLRVTPRRDVLRRSKLRLWRLRLLAGAGGLWLLLTVVVSLSHSA